MRGVRPTHTEWSRSVVWAVLTGLAYYGGAALGHKLRIAPDGTAVLWPPVALLTAAFLSAPRQRWPAITLGALTGHLLATSPDGVVVVFRLWSFVATATEAVVATLLLGRLSDNPRRFDSLRRLGAFLAAVVVAAPIVSTCLMALVLTMTNDSGSFVWHLRVPTHMLTQLTLTPAAVALVTSRPSWLRRAPGARQLEAALLGLAVIAQNVVGGPLKGATGSSLPLEFHLPVALWAALRFGPVGVSATFLTIVCMATWSFSRPPNVDGPVTAIFQGIIGCAALTLLCLATLFEERRQSTRALGERLRFEQLLFQFTRTFVQVSSETTETASREWLERIGRFLGVDCVRLFQVTPPTDVTLMFEWRRSGVPTARDVVFGRDFPWITSRMAARMPVVLASLSALPPEAARDRELLTRQGYKAALIMPLLAGDETVGAIAFGSTSHRVWADEVVTNLQLMSDVLANALARRRADSALMASEVMKSGILDSLNSGVAVIDADGRLLEVNMKWRQLIEVSTHLRYGGAGIGDDLVQMSAPEIRHGLQAVLDGSRPRFVDESASTTAAGTRWWLLNATCMNRAQGGAVLTLTEITERRRAEIEAHQTRLALAHVERVSTIGELTASLAHHLSQPLTGMMTNAQAARRLLVREPPDTAEAGDAMRDIVEDAHRAADVVKRMRDILRRGELTMAPVDLCAVARDVAHLVGSDAIIRRISLTLDLDPPPIHVNADRVQLQQLILNLIINAFEAIGEQSAMRSVRVTCRRTEEGGATVVVADSGSGLPEGNEQAVFDPFFTTKPEGMGLGLSIARSIVETHGGSIRARNMDGGGAIIEFRLPPAAAVQFA